MGRAKYAKELCYICGLKMPSLGRYIKEPWHLACPYDEAGKKKVAQWKREQKKIAKSEVPTLSLPD